MSRLAVRRATWLCLGTILYLGGCGSGGAPDEIASLTVLVADSSKTQIEVREVQSAFVRVDPLTTRLGGAVALDADLSRISKIRQQEGNRLHTITFVDGSEVSGRLTGHLEGKSGGTPQAVSWANVQSAEVRTDEPLRDREVPDGPWLRVSGDGIEPLEVFGLEIETAWIVRHGTHAYRRDRAESEALPFTVRRENEIREQWMVPLPWLVRVEIRPYLTTVVLANRDGDLRKLDGEVGGSLTQNDGEAGFTGVDHRGRWQISVQKIKRAVMRAGQGRPTTLPAAQVSLEVFGRRRWEPPPLAPVGELVDWDGRKLKVLSTALETLEMRSGESMSEFRPETIERVEATQNPWKMYDEGESAPQWIAARVYLRDGSVADGDLMDHFGSLECQDDDGVVLHVPSTAIQFLSLNAENPPK